METGLVEQVFTSFSKVLGDSFCGFQEFVVYCFTLYCEHVVVCIFVVQSEASGVTGAHCSVLLCHASHPSHVDGYEVNICVSDWQAMLLSHGLFVS